MRITIRKISIFLSIIVTFTYGQSVRSLVSSGNDLYDKKQYSDAEAEYKKSLEKEKGLVQGYYNLGSAVNKQQRYDEAIQNYQMALEKTQDKNTQSQLYYNIGNSLFESQQYKESIDAYKKSLKINPSDEDAKYNLAYALKKLQEQQQQQKQNNNKNQQDKKDQQKQDQQKQQQNQQQKQQQQKQQQEEQKKQMQQKDADRILEALKNDEKNTQKKVRRKVPVRINVEKDW